MKVTAVHELFHAIQIGKFGIWPEDIYFYEILSSWSENFAFPDIKDYYQYLPTYFNSTNTPFWSRNHPGYDLAIWGIFLEQKFSVAIIKTILENSMKYNPMKTMDVSLRQYSSSFSKEFAEFSNWILFTGYRAIGNTYFKDAKDYPVISGSSIKRIQYTLPVMNVNTLLYSYSTQFYEFIKGNDTINIISVHTNDQEAFERTLNYGSSGFQIAPDIKDDKAIPLMDDMKVLFVSESPVDWKNFYLINRQYYSTTSYEIKAFPNPLYLSNSGAGKISFNIPAKIGDETELFVFSSDMRLIYQGKQAVKSVFMKPGIDWDCVNLDNKTVSSGIYFYVIKANGKEWKNKFAVVKKK